MINRRNKMKYEIKKNDIENILNGDKKYICEYFNKINDLINEIKNNKLKIYDLLEQKEKLSSKIKEIVKKYEKDILDENTKSKMYPNDTLRKIELENRTKDDSTYCENKTLLESIEKEMNDLNCDIDYQEKLFRIYNLLLNFNKN